MSRPYKLTKAASDQRREAALARWAAMPGKSERREALRAAFTVTPGRPRKAKTGPVK